VNTQEGSGLCPGDMKHAPSSEKVPRRAREADRVFLNEGGERVFFWLTTTWLVDLCGSMGDPMRKSSRPVVSATRVGLDATSIRGNCHRAGLGMEIVDVWYAVSGRAA